MLIGWPRIGKRQPSAGECAFISGCPPGPLVHWTTIVVMSVETLLRVVGELDQIVAVIDREHHLAQDRDPDFSRDFNARVAGRPAGVQRSEEHTSELQSLRHLVCRLLLEKK